ncbi:MAG: XRE family transcriptional regulator [Microbacterium sp.]|nr:MAG: XRE family transcriptional regulator [Microbacterium sp.]
MQRPRSHASAHVGRLVYSARSRQNLTRRTVAARADLDISHLARIENGRGNPTLHVLIQLAVALGLRPEQFLEGLGADDLPADDAAADELSTDGPASA